MTRLTKDNQPSEYLIPCILLSISYKEGECFKVSKAKLYNIDKGEIFYHTFVCHKSAIAIISKYLNDIPIIKEGFRIDFPSRVEIQYNVKIGKFYHGPPRIRVTKLEENTLSNGC